MAASGGAKGAIVLVTGASGFIGSCLVRNLLDRGYSVHAGVLNPGYHADDKAETDHLHAMADEGRLRVFRCDLLDGADRDKPNPSPDYLPAATAARLSTTTAPPWLDSDLQLFLPMCSPQAS
ncbi:hypothetical protein EJB05_03868, partial [Eragrostis curvula]